LINTRAESPMRGYRLVAQTLGMKWVGVLLLVLLLMAAAPFARAEGLWLPVGDRSLRNDITLLVDEGVIRVPTTTWPLPVADIRRAVDRVDAEQLAIPALAAALERVKARVAVRADAEGWELRESSFAIGHQGALRDYGSFGRGNGEIQSVGGTSNERWGLTISAAAVSNPLDGHRFELDGSDLTVRWGNWLFSVNQLDRWYGPGEEQSLSLSNNARPLPQLSLDRSESTAPTVPILSWIGPWRFTTSLGA
jgi:hypothetical protein